MKIQFQKVALNCIIFLVLTSVPAVADKTKVFPRLPSNKQKKMPNSSESVWVSKADGQKSCEKNSGIALEFGAQELKTVGIEVFGAKKGNDGKMRAQMCGLSAGTQNQYLIKKANLSKLPVGYKSIAQDL